MKPPDTGWSSVTVKVIALPSAALASLMVRAGLSSLLMVPVAVSVAITLESPVTVKPTVNVSLGSSTASSVV